ncbi:guanylate kinase [Caldisalinibacter kiritimatiensis]|uniref:Guanylate kinase n=1 Tax=Caldisalinibacter kiritimatiensis TaxID=1304284 RepID=R1CXF9_9FIRM|nr:guanylate kinase [Caldisalinibacter kiritimatiensis]EOD01309.1 Guanylate kinase [Caldisalinibacter kiritimatiensis]
MNKGLLIVLSGPSGAGKGTICKAFLKENKDFILSVSATTRKPREGEIDGVNYFFITKEDFEKKIQNDEFLEYASVYGSYYGTPKSFVIENLNKGKDVILEIDIQGALQIKERYPEGVFIFIVPPSMKELRNRIEKRGTETEEAINERFSSAFNELNFASKYDYVVVNDEVNKAVKRIEAIVMAEKCKIERQKEVLNKVKEV